ncbi:MAG: glycosyltransferase [Oscillospiraceae bacterium]|nr:glycosyltransferase [Oscillospiraceae bacterium]
MLTVLHLLGDCPHESVQRNIIDESRFFARHGVDVHAAYDPFSRASLETDFIDSLQALGARTYKIPYLKHTNAQMGQTNAQMQQQPPIRQRKSGMSALRAALIVREMCATYQIDIIHTHDESAFRLACAVRFLGAPIVHIYTAHAATENAVSAYLLNRVISLWCDEFIAIDAYIAGVLLDRFIGMKKIKRINCGIDLNQWSKRKAMAEAGTDAGTDTGMDTGRDAGMDAGTDTVAARTGSSLVGYAGVDIDAVEKTALDAAEDGITILMIADSDPIGDGTVYDSFADLVLRMLHDFETRFSNKYSIRFIIATNSDYGLRYAVELINTLDLNDCVEIARLSGNGGGDNGGFDPENGAAGNGTVINGAAGNSAAINSTADNGTAGNGTADNGMAGSGTADNDMADNGVSLSSMAENDASQNDVSPDAKSTWSAVQVGNWVEAETKIKLRSFKYKAESKLSKSAKNNMVGVKLHNLECASARMALYSQADLCVYYSENRFFPYPVAEAIALGVPTLTNDKGFVEAAFATEKSNAGEERGGEREREEIRGDEIKDDEVRDYEVRDDEVRGDEIRDDEVNGGEALYSGLGAVFEPVDFGDPDELARRVLMLIGDDAFRKHFIALEEKAVRSRYDIEDMIIGIYDSYVKGLRA